MVEIRKAADPGVGFRGLEAAGGCREIIFFRLRLFDAVHFSLIHDLDIEVAKFNVNLIQFFR